MSSLRTLAKGISNGLALFEALLETTPAIYNDIDLGKDDLVDITRDIEATPDEVRQRLKEIDAF